jgi:hypothetical protein
LSPAALSAQVIWTSVTAAVMFALKADEAALAGR